MKKTSVLIPVYNRENMLGECIQSALNQTVQPFEIIVVDNASTDDTWRICQEFARKDATVRVFRNESNIGPVRNWLRCMEEARGDYAKLLYSDDVIYPTYLEKTTSYLDDPKVGFVFTAVDVGVDTRQTVVSYEWAGNPTVSSSSQFIHDALLLNSLPLSPGCALFRLPDMKKNLLLTIPSPAIQDFASHGAGPDLLLYLLTAKQYSKIAHLGEPLAFFRAHSDSITIGHPRWFIYRRYQQARIWFAAQYGNQQTLGILLAEMWMSECKNERRLMLPSHCARQYTTQFAWSWLSVAKVFMQRLRMRLGK